MSRAQTLVQEEVSYRRDSRQLGFPLHQMSKQDRGDQVDQVDQNDLQKASS